MRQFICVDESGWVDATGEKGGVFGRPRLWGSSTDGLRAAYLKMGILHSLEAPMPVPCPRFRPETN